MGSKARTGTGVAPWQHCSALESAGRWWRRLQRGRVRRRGCLGSARSDGYVLAPADFLSKFSWSGWPVARLKFLKFSQSNTTGACASIKAMVGHAHQQTKKIIVDIT